MKNLEHGLNMEMMKYRLGDIAKIFDGPHATPRKTESGPIYLGVDAITEDCKINPSEFAYLSENDYKIWTKRVVPQHKDIVFSYEATLGRYAIIPEDFYGCLGRRLGLVRIIDDRVDYKWLYYFFQSPQWTNFIKSHTIKGSTVNRISVDEMPSYEIPCVAMSEQKKIAAVLSALDDKIALNKKMNQKLEAMAKRLYDYWFVQFDFPDENGRPYKTSGGPMTHNPTLNREIPEGWGVALISDVINPIERGISYTSEDIENTSGVPMINLACFDKKGNYRTGELKFYSGEFGESNKVYPLDMLIACTDLTQKADIIGTPIFLSAESPFYVFSTDLAKISPRDELHKYFLYYYLKDPTFHRYIKPFASGTTVKHLNVKGVENYPIFIPMENVVKQFTDMVCPIVKSINERINEINKLTALRDKLLPLLMNGQVEV